MYKRISQMSSMTYGHLYRCHTASTCTNYCVLLHCKICTNECKITYVCMYSYVQVYICIYIYDVSTIL